MWETCSVRAIPRLFLVTRFNEVGANFEQERAVTKSEMACTLFFGVYIDCF